MSIGEPNAAGQAWNAAARDAARAGKGALAPYAADVRRSRGRLVAESQSPIRSPYARDRDRILHSTAFRRLNYKTQVFIYHDGDHYRSRLTHSLEVSQIGRSLARALRLDEDLTETIALAHDLGHPPFGHAGERALDAAIADAGGFDHNAQSLRVVTKLERLYGAFDGLNLTWETLEGLVKHNGPLGGEGEPIPEPILDYCETHDLELDSFASLEAQIAALSDDIAYNAHDIDDGYRAGCFTFAELADIPLAGRSLHEVDVAYPGLEPARRLYETKRRLITAMVNDVLAETNARLDALSPSSADDVRAASRATVSFSGAMRDELQQLHAFLFDRVYRHPRMVRIMGEAEDLVVELFQRYVGNPDVLPSEWRGGAEVRDARAYARHVADFIAGQTDRYALAEHRRLFDATPIAIVARHASSGAFMDVFSGFHGHVLAAVQQLKHDGIVPVDASVDGISLEAPKDPSHGDLATNAAMVLAKPSKLAPRVLAERIVPLLASDPSVETVGIAGPGFINITLKPAFWPKVLRMVVEQDEGVRTQRAIGKGQAVNVEYVSANPTGPMHVGHCRGAVFGDALANLLAFAGYDVTREYYVNDAGAQVDVLARSAFLRYREALGETIGEIPEGLYPGDYLKPVGESLAANRGRDLLELPEEEWLPVVRAAALKAMIGMIEDDLAQLGIRHDVFFSERSLIEGADEVAETIDALNSKGLVYEGRLPPPKGKVDEEWEDREQLLFRSSGFGDDQDRPLVKADGSYTYFASDIAYHYDKFRRGFRSMIDVWGADHSGHIKRMQAALKALTDGRADLDVKVCQLVRLFRSGEPVKMSKRAGTFVTLRDVVDEVGPGSVRFMMLYRKNDAPLDFDFVKVTEQSRDNPVFYVQYAHARASSVLRNVREAFPDMELEGAQLAQADLDRLIDDGEFGLIRRFAQFPRVVEAAAQAHEPHRIAFYLNDLAGDFHGLWNRGKDLPQLRFIHQSDRELTRARVALVAATQRILALGLGILGVRAVHEMH